MANSITATVARATGISTYEGLAPDGSVLQYRTKRFQTPTVQMRINSYGGGCWYPEDVAAAPDDYKPSAGVKSQWIAAERVA